MINYTLIGERVREIRKIQHMTQGQLSERAALSSPYISHIETGKKKASLEALTKISNVLGVTVNDLLCGNHVFDPFEYHSDMTLLLSDCSSQEKRILYEVAASLKKILRENGKT